MWDLMSENCKRSCYTNTSSWSREETQKIKSYGNSEIDSKKILTTNDFGTKLTCPKPLLYCCCRCWFCCCRELISFDIGRFQASSIEGNWRRFDVIDGIGAWDKCCCRNLIRCDKLWGFPPLVVTQFLRLLDDEVIDTFWISFESPFVAFR